MSSRHDMSLAASFGLLARGDTIELSRTVKVQASSMYGVTGKSRRERYEERKQAHMSRRRATWGPNAWKVHP